MRGKGFRFQVSSFWFTCAEAFWSPGFPSGGNGPVRPAWYSASASRARPSNLPAFTSSSIWRSHSLSNRPFSHVTSWKSFSRGNSSIALPEERGAVFRPGVEKFGTVHRDAVAVRSAPLRPIISAWSGAFRGRLPRLRARKQNRSRACDCNYSQTDHRFRH